MNKNTLLISFLCLSQTGHEESATDSDILKKKKLKLSYESYRNMSNLLIMHMRKEEATMEEEESSETAGLRRSAVINWYLNEISGDIETESELIEKKMLVEKVLDRLTYHVSFLKADGRCGFRLLSLLICVMLYFRQMP